MSLETGQITSSLADYLSSFSGLEKLIVGGRDYSQLVKGVDSFLNMASAQARTNIYILGRGKH